tara:strand:- start:57 stop:344 length:288 start_codon:yes stop_codon:yes gene_type:complete
MPFIIILPNRRNWVITLTIPQFSHMLTLFTVRDEAMSDEILTIQELAEYLKLNEKTAYRLAGEGKLPGFKVGGSWRFKRVDIEQWIEQQKHKDSE